MNIGVYFCRCGSDNTGNVSSKIDVEEVGKAVLGKADIAYYETINLACSEDGQTWLENDIRTRNPDRVVIAACSPREHEETFRRVMIRAGKNPYLMHLVNVREHVAWVTEDRGKATKKAIAYVLAAARRVRLHEPLEKRMLDVCPDVLVIGGGPAGLKAALSLAEAGRKVTLVDRSPILGGLPVRYEDIFPKMECGPCLLEPFLGQVLHSDVSDNIDICLQSEVVEVNGFFGNFIAKIRKRPRFVSLSSCIGCGICMPECPVEIPSPVNLNRSTRKAIDFEFFGGLPNVPFIDPNACVRFKGEDCAKCRDTCPVEGVINFDDKEEIVEKRIGGIIVAIGAKLYDVSRIPNLGYGRLPDVYSSFEFERIIAGNGPTGGQIVTKDGRSPKRIAIVHCAGSLDERHLPHCSAVCCLNAFKFNHIIGHKEHEAEIIHYFKTIVAPGKEEHACYEHAKANEHARFIQYGNLDDLQVESGGEGAPMRVTCATADADAKELACDIVVLMGGLEASDGAAQLSKMLEVSQGQAGFFEELNGRADPSRAKKRGIYLAGICQAPGDIARSMMQGVAAAGHALSALVEGRQMAIEPVTAEVDAARCSGCRTCIPVCPYKAIEHVPDEGVAKVNPVLCVGCGTCVAACPAGSIKGNHFTNDEIFAEIEALLR